MKLTRFFRDETCTLGTMVSNDGAFTCAILERPASGDHPCIPPGTYAVGYEIHHPNGPHPYRCPVLDTSALGRSHIQIHVANEASELLGCLATGEDADPANHRVNQSQSAFDRLMAYLDGVDTFTLDIVEDYAE